jgi:hypothetical protein
MIWDHFQRPRFGAFCIKPCRSGFCYAPAANVLHAYCTRTCASAADCPPDYECVPGAANQSAFCRRVPHGKLGDRCAAPEECLSNLCVEYVLVDRQQGRFRNLYCVDPCPATGACPDGSQCEEVGAERVCSPRPIIEREAQRRFDLEKRLSIENEMFLDRRLERERSGDAGREGEWEVTRPGRE